MSSGKGPPPLRPMSLPSTEGKKSSPVGNSRAPRPTSAALCRAPLALCRAPLALCRAPLAQSGSCLRRYVCRPSRRPSGPSAPRHHTGPRHQLTSSKAFTATRRSQLTSSRACAWRAACCCLPCPSPAPSARARSKTRGPAASCCSTSAVPWTAPARTSPPKLARYTTLIVFTLRRSASPVATAQGRARCPRLWELLRRRRRSCRQRCFP